MATSSQEATRSGYVPAKRLNKQFRPAFDANVTRYRLGPARILDSGRAFR
jgi:hypothetical protein